MNKRSALWRERGMNVSSTAADAWTAAATRVSGQQERTRSAGTRDAIIDHRDALLHVGGTTMTCLNEILGNYSGFKDA